MEGSPVNKVIFKGADATLSLGEILQLNLQYMYRSDDRVWDGNYILGKSESNGYMAEIILSPGGDDSNWYALGMINKVDSDLNPFEHAGYDYASWTLHAGYILRRNVRLVAEYTWDFTNKNKAFGRASFGFVSAF